MSTNKSNKPELRFKGFSDDWEQRKVGDCFTERVESMPDGELISVTINDGIKKFSELGRHDNSNDDKSKYKKVCVGDIAYNSMRMWQGASGYSPYEGIVSPAYTVLSPNSGINSKCLAYQFKLPDIIHTFQVNSQGITSDNWNLKYPALSQIEIFVSKDEQEQAKIAKCFENLDNLIALHQRKCDNLKIIKKSMLDNLFPKNGEKVPKWRFKGFNNDWEQRKLSDIYNDIGNAFVGTATPYYVEKGHFYLESNNVKDGQINHKTEVFINDKFYEMQKAKWLHTGDMVMVQSGHVGHAAVIPKELNCLAAHALIMFRNPKIKIEPYFLNYQYQTNNAKKKIENITTGNTIKHILASDMQEFVVDVALYREQEKIAKYFRNLDNLITLHQSEVERLKKAKQFFLDKMFI